jgi:exodeoxyribonuclease VII small subunit
MRLRGLAVPLNTSRVVLDSMAQQPAKPTPPDDSSGEPVATSFEAALAELETIVARMESGELPLEESLAAYKRGAQLLQFCQAALQDAQQQVQILEAGLLQEFSSGESDE